MCGRYALGLPHYDIQQMHGYNLQAGEWVNQDQYQPRYNVAPRSQAPVIRNRRDGPSNAAGSSGAGSNSAPEGIVLHTMKWGLVPHWSKHEDLTLNTINARAENLAEGTGMWRSLRGWKRCAVPCEGYYEWLKKGKERLPHFTKRKDGKLLLLAGLYDSVILEGQTEPLYTFTIVTTDANQESSWLHDRQPVMLSTVESMNLWLDTANHKWDPQVVDLLQPYHDEEAPLVCYQVPKEVGKVGTDSPTFVQPISERKDGIQAMFSRQAQKATDSPSSSQPSSQPKLLAPGTPSKRKRSSSPLPSSSQSKLAPKTPTKRRRSPSPPLSLSPLKVLSPAKGKKSAETYSESANSGQDVIDLSEPAEDSTDPKLEKMNTWEDDEIEIIDAPTASSSKDAKDEDKLPPAKKTKTSSSSKKSSSPKKTKRRPAKGSEPKITSFFNRSKA